MTATATGADRLAGPVPSTLARLAVPNLGEAAARVLFLSVDAAYVARLGEDAAAGVAVVFPLFIAQQTVTAAGLGAGVNAAIARQLGARNPHNAGQIATTATAYALVAGTILSAVMLTAGPGLYRAIGASGPAADAAATYGRVLFAGSVFVWLMNTLANIARGQGRMTSAATAIICGEAAHLCLSPTLTTGWGPAPNWGVAGAAAAVIASYLVGSAVLLATLRTPDTTVPLRWGRPNPRYLQAILRVGAPAAFVAVMFQVGLLSVTRNAATYGDDALAGYGLASRVELLQLPVTFALGSAVVAMISHARGAAQPDRAAAIARAGTLAGAGIGAVFALAALTLPALLDTLTSDDIATVAATYLRYQAPALPLTGAALCAYYALQGNARLAVPTLLAVARLTILVTGGTLITQIAATPTPLFVLVAASSATYALAILTAARGTFTAKGHQG